MAFALDEYIATSEQTDFVITYQYQAQEDVKVIQNGSTLTVTIHYTFYDASTIRLVTGATTGDIILLQRSTSQTKRDVDFTPGVLTEADLDNSNIQSFFMAQEAIDIANRSMLLNSSANWEAQSKLIQNVLDPTTDQDVATKNYVDNIAIGELGSPISIENGGTGASTPSEARTTLSAQTQDDDLDTLAALTTIASLVSLADLTTAADKMPYTTASNTYATTVLTTFARSLLDDVNATAARTTLEITGVDIQTFTSDGTWTKPTAAVSVLVQAWGAGGSGGQATSSWGGGGGGGGGYMEARFLASDLGSTEDVTIGLGGTSKTTSGNGRVGDNTTFGSLLTIYGGGGGNGGGGSSGGGGGGGCALSVGNTGSGVTGGVGGGTYGTLSAGGGMNGGDGGKGDSTNGNNKYGHPAIWGGGGGGGGKGNDGWAGGNSVWGGGGGSAGAGSGASGPGGTSVYGGDGGVGNTGGTAGTAGTQPGGGGGGTETGDSGAGGNGQIIIITYI
jgi:hypothetical protein